MTGAQRGGIIFRLMFLLTLVALATLVYLARYPLLRLAGGWWVVTDRPERSDAILVLGDDNFNGDRAAKAAELYRAGLAPLVVASGRLLRPYAGVAELIVRDLENRGVPENAIVQFPQRAENTREESLALRGLVMSRGWHKVLAVTSNYHTRRARYIFHNVFPPQITVLVVPAPDSEYDPDTWWESRQGTKLFMLETGGYLEALWEARRGASETSAISTSPSTATSANPALH